MLTRFRSSWLLCALGCVSLFGCQNYRDQLQRGQGYYEQNQYETALAVWRHLESDQDSLSPTEVVRYCYLRGMTDFRLGFREDARYWLGLAKAGEKKATGALLSEELSRLDLTLDELNAEVFGGGEKKAEAFADSCKWTSDCEPGFACQDNLCIQAEVGTDPSAPSESEDDAPTAPAPAK